MVARLAPLALVLGLLVGGCGDDKPDMAKPDKDAEYATKMQAYFPGLESEADARDAADELCSQIRDAGSFEALNKRVSMGMAFGGKTDDPRLFEQWVTIMKAMHQVAMPWRCPEFYDDAKTYIAANGGE